MYRRSADGQGGGGGGVVKETGATRCLTNRCRSLEHSRQAALGSTNSFKPNPLRDSAEFSRQASTQVIRLPSFLAVFDNTDVRFNMEDLELPDGMDSTNDVMAIFGALLHGADALSFMDCSLIFKRRRPDLAGCRTSSSGC